MDRRQRKTRDAIFQAFTALLETKSYSSITVQDIIDQRLTHMLYHLADNRHYIKGILSRESGELFMGYLKERLSKVFAEHLKPTLDIVPD